MIREVTTKYKTTIGFVYLTEKEIGILELLSKEVYVYIDEKENAELFEIVFNLFTRNLIQRINVSEDYRDKWSFAIDEKGKLVFETEEYKKRVKRVNRNKVIDNILK